MKRLLFPSGEAVTADMAVTPAELSRGLAGRLPGSKVESMLFWYPAPDARRGMTMAGMKYALDFFFLSSGGLVLAIVRGVAPSRTDTIMGPPCRFVLETPVWAIRNVAVGQRVQEIDYAV